MSMISAARLVASSSGMSMDIASIIFHLAATAGVVIIKHIIEVYTSYWFYAPIIDEPSPDDAMPHQKPVFDQPVNATKIASPPAKTCAEDSHIPTSPDHCYPNFRAVAAPVLCNALTVVTDAMVLSDSTQPRLPAGSFQSTPPSDIASTSFNLSPHRPIDTPVDVSGQSGGNPPGRGPNDSRESSNEIKDSVDSRNEPTSEDSSPPPPPPPSFLASAQNGTNKRKVDWISLLLLLSLVFLALKRFVVAFCSDDQPPTTAVKPNDILSRILADLGIMDHVVTPEMTYSNGLPLRGSACVSAPHAGAGMESYTDPLPMRGCNSGTVPSASVKKNALSGWIEFASTTCFMASSIALSLLPLLLFYLAGYYLDDDARLADEKRERTAENSVSDEAFSSSDLYSIISEDGEEFDDSLLSEDLLRDMLLENVRPLLEQSKDAKVSSAHTSDMGSETISQLRMSKAGRSNLSDQRFFGAIASTPRSDIMIATTSEQLTPTGPTLNPKATVFIPRRMGAEVTPRQDATFLVGHTNSFFTPTPSAHRGVPIVSPSPYRPRTKRRYLNNGGSRNRFKAVELMEGGTSAVTV
ncbi:hypothetical protein GALMADRAFT_231409 [Galerina marginata CBS 339.88]|uniref:Uncharacterized protein n=1 Tax=Galerina marginata (strain CBS 339.88) TaxID=685588 RepID=A0A067SNY4_GALM3|nr:hypothetical protein GALMADRAFT_231409 [Galerina marginata CBS 339.88]